MSLEQGIRQVADIGATSRTDQSVVKIVRSNLSSRQKIQNTIPKTACPSAWGLPSPLWESLLKCSACVRCARIETVRRGKEWRNPMSNRQHACRTPFTARDVAKRHPVSALFSRGLSDYSAIPVPKSYTKLDIRLQVIYLHAFTQKTMKSTAQ